MVGELHAPRPRRERAEAFEEGDWIEADAGGAIAIVLLQAIADTTIGQQRQAVLEDRWARGISAENLEALATVPTPSDREIRTFRDLKQMPGAQVAKMLSLVLLAMKSRLHLVAELRRRLPEMGSP